MKHFLHLSDFSKQEIIRIFELADTLKADNGEGDWLKGKRYYFSRKAVLERGFLLKRE